MSDRYSSAYEPESHARFTETDRLKTRLHRIEVAAVAVLEHPLLRDVKQLYPGDVPAQEGSLWGKIAALRTAMETP